MKSSDRIRLTTALRDHVGKIAADLRIKMRTFGDIRTRAEQLHVDEQVAEDFDVWTDLLSRRAAVLWVLKSVYVRVLEDRGLLRPGRLLDQEAQQLFERLAPHLGETAFLRWVYRDLASPHDGLPELFSLQPAEVAVPSNELSRALIAFWRHRDADSGAVWSFAEERFEGELMGDLYQELDPVVKDRFALCQTPDFVRAFILDRTLTPAIETFGADKVRLLDPACGSGHFLIDGLKRLVAATAAKHGDWDCATAVAHSLERIVGVDLNDYACGLARARLIMTAAELAGVTKLADAARFRPHVYWGDGLEQVERGEQKSSLQYELFERIEKKPVSSLTPSAARVALRKVFENKFHAIVANPPYITEKDAAKKRYHRERVGSAQRYISATGKYSLGSPFLERCFQLAEPDGFVGVITSNNFMKREFGKPLIEKVLVRIDLTLVVDASQARIPFHVTPTVLLFARNRRPSLRGGTIRTVMGKRGESGLPSDPSQDKVWKSIENAWNTPGFENEYINVADLQSSTLAKHPWSLGGGGVSELKSALEAAAPERLKNFVRAIGFASFPASDEVFMIERAAQARLGISAEHTRELVVGENVRDWSFSGTGDAVVPYSRTTQELLSVGELGATAEHFWRYRSYIDSILSFGGKTRKEEGTPSWAWYRWIADRIGASRKISFAAIATHNHFVLDRGGRVYNNKAPVLVFPPDVADGQCLSLLGLLNSSSACFWMKQVFYPKGSATSDISRDGLTPENNRYEFAGTGMESLPVPSGLLSSRVASIARRIEELASARELCSPLRVTQQSLSGPIAKVSAEALKEALANAEIEERSAFERMVFWQEELDWAIYELFGLIPTTGNCRLHECQVTPEERPFTWKTSPPEALISRDQGSLYVEYKRRRSLIDSTPQLRLLENRVQKRLWRGTQGVFGRYDRTFADKTASALREWLGARVELAAKERGSVFTIEQIAAHLQDDRATLAACEALTNRRDFSISQLVADALRADSVPNIAYHVYKASGLIKREVWDRVWFDQRRADAGEEVLPELPPTYGIGDFLRAEHWALRGKLDVPKERFIAFTEIPGRAGLETAYGWAGWTPVQRLKAILAVDEELEDATVPLADRIGLLDSAWRLLPEVAREDAAAAARLKAELQALVGPEGPSRELIENWKERFPPPTTQATRTKRAAAAREEDDGDNEDTDEP